MWIFFVSDWVLEWNPPESSLWFDSFHESVAATLYKSFASHSRPFFCVAVGFQTHANLHTHFGISALETTRSHWWCVAWSDVPRAINPSTHHGVLKSPTRCSWEGLAVCFQRRKWWILQMNKTPQNCWILGPIWRIFDIWNMVEV